MSSYSLARLAFLIICMSAVHPNKGLAIDDAEEEAWKKEAVAAFVGHSIGIDRGNIPEKVLANHALILQAFRSNSGVDESFIKELHFSLAKMYARMAESLVSELERNATEQELENAKARIESWLLEVEKELILKAEDKSWTARAAEVRKTAAQRFINAQGVIADAIEKKVLKIAVSRSLLPPYPETVTRFGEETEYKPSEEGDKTLAVLAILDIIRSSLRSASRTFDESVSNDLIVLLAHLPLSDEDKSNKGWHLLQSKGDLLNILPNFNGEILIVKRRDAFDNIPFLILMSSVNQRHAYEQYSKLIENETPNAAEWSANIFEQVVESKDYVIIDPRRVISGLRLQQSIDAANAAN